MLPRKSRPVWGAWIEIVPVVRLDTVYRPSRPVWGAWIEMNREVVRMADNVVAPRMGRVD